MTYRLCVDCGKPTASTRCAAHTALWNQRRTLNYGPAHQAARQALALTLPTLCGYCGRSVRVGDRWVAAHVRDGDPASPRIVAHPACNERAKAVLKKAGEGSASAW